MHNFTTSHLREVYSTEEHQVEHCPQTCSYIFSQSCHFLHYVPHLWMPTPLHWRAPPWLENPHRAQRRWSGLKPLNHMHCSRMFAWQTLQAWNRDETRIRGPPIVKWSFDQTTVVGLLKTRQCKTYVPYLCWYWFRKPWVSFRTLRLGLSLFSHLCYQFLGFVQRWCRCRMGCQTHRGLRVGLLHLQLKSAPKEWFSVPPSESVDEHHDFFRSFSSQEMKLQVRSSHSRKRRFQYQLPY